MAEAENAGGRGGRRGCGTGSWGASGSGGGWGARLPWAVSPAHASFGGEGRTRENVAFLQVSPGQPVPYVTSAQGPVPSRLLSAPRRLPSGRAGPRASGERCLGWRWLPRGVQPMRAGGQLLPALGAGDAPSYHLMEAARSGGVESARFIFFYKPKKAEFQGVYSRLCSALLRCPSRGDASGALGGPPRAV